MGKAGRGGCSTLWESVCGKRKGDDAMRRGAFIFIRIDCIDDDAAHVTFSSDPNSLRASALPLVKLWPGMHMVDCGSLSSPSA